MSRTGKLILKVVGIPYLLFAAYFVYVTVKQEGTIIVPRMVDYKDVRESGDVTITPDTSKATIHALAGRRLRPRQDLALPEGGALKTDDTRAITWEDWQAVQKLARESKPRKVLVLIWDPRFILEVAGKGYTLAQRPDDLPSSITLEKETNGEEEVIRLDEHNLILLARDYQAADYVPIRKPEDGIHGYRARLRVRGGGAAPGLDLTLVFMGLNFLALLAVLYSFLWEPITRLLDDRSASIKKDVDDARADRDEAERLRAEAEEELARAREAAKPGETESTVGDSIPRADVARISIRVAERLLGRRVDEGHARRLIDEVISEIESDGREE